MSGPDSDSAEELSTAAPQRQKKMCLPAAFTMTIVYIPPSLPASEETVSERPVAVLHPCMSEWIFSMAVYHDKSCYCAPYEDLLLNARWILNRKQLSLGC